MVGSLRPQRLAANGFLLITDGREFFVDLKNGVFYARMPELVLFGYFEIETSVEVCIQGSKSYLRSRLFGRGLAWRIRALGAAGNGVS